MGAALLALLFGALRAKRAEGKVPIALKFAGASWLVTVALLLFGQDRVVSEQDLDDWIYTYDPFLRPEDGAPRSGSYNNMEEWATAISLRERVASVMHSDTTRERAVSYVNASKPGEEWLGYLVRYGLISHDQINQDWLLGETDKLSRWLALKRDQYPESDVPLTGLHFCVGRYLPLINAGLLSEQEREQLVKEVVAGLHWEVRLEAPDGWATSSQAEQEGSNFSLRDVHAGVQLLIALGASQEVTDAEGVVLEAMKMCYREAEGRGRAGFESYTKRGAANSVNRYVGSAAGAANALSLMGVYGTPDFVDLPAFHKHLIDMSVGQTSGDNYPKGSHPAREYLAAAARFRLEQLHPEL